MSGLADLARRLAAATGADPDLDDALAAALAVPRAGFTSSVEQCRRLVAAVLPAAVLHVGYGVPGVFPYAAVTVDGRRSAVEAPTVPLAILRAMVEALRGLPPVPPA